MFCYFLYRARLLKKLFIPVTRQFYYEDNLAESAAALNFQLSHPLSGLTSHLESGFNFIKIPNK
jgi:hypothetical protein